MSGNPHSMSLYKANIASALLFIPLSVFMLGPYIAIWGWTKTARDLTLFYNHIVVFLLLVVSGIVLHELLHGLTWMWMGKKSWNRIKFGFNWSALAPFAHCREPLEINAYRWGAAMPGLLLGIVPFVIGFFTGYGWFTLFGYLFVITASGDILILWLIRLLKPGTYVLDHPEQAGCQVVDTDTILT